jgi:hypothetical protein
MQELPKVPMVPPLSVVSLTAHRGGFSLYFESGREAETIRLPKKLAPPS